MSHAVLLGDSVFDNAAYVDGGASVIQQVGTLLAPDWKATLLALDGSVTADVATQLDSLPSDATHLIISCGGNDALGQFGVLKEAVQSVHGALSCMDQLRSAFQKRYRQMLALAAASRKRLAVCTIYDAIPTLDRPALCAIALFNDIIIREAALAGVPVIDLRTICTLPAHYSRMSPIEPSASGGGKIASVIATMLETHDFMLPHCVVYVSRDA